MAHEHEDVAKEPLVGRFEFDHFAEIRVRRGARVRVEVVGGQDKRKPFDLLTRDGEKRFGRVLDEERMPVHRARAVSYREKEFAPHQKEDLHELSGRRAGP